MSRSAERLQVMTKTVCIAAATALAGCQSASTDNGTAGNSHSLGGESSSGGTSSNRSSTSSLTTLAIGGSSGQGGASTTKASSSTTQNSGGSGSQGGTKSAGGTASSNTTGGNSSSQSTGGKTGTSVGGTAATNTGGKSSTSVGGTTATSVGGKSGSGGTTATSVGGKSNTGGIGGKSSGGSSSSSPGGIGSLGGSSGTNANATGGSVSGSAPTITNLKIEANPNNVLSAYVSWTTDKASDSAVQFGEGTTYKWEVTDSAQVTSHKVLIIGMHAGKAHQIKAISSAGGSSANATGSYTTGALPSQIPVGTVAVNDTTKVQSGWTLMNVNRGDGNSMGIPSSSYPAIAVMYDSEGQPVWYHMNGTTNDYGGAISVDLTDKGVLIGPVVGSSSVTGEPPREVDFAGNTLWQCSDPNCGTTDGYLSHHASKLSNGNYVSLRWITTNNNQSPVFEEYTSANKKVWSLDFGKLVPMPSGASGDWCHGNAITVDIDNDAVYANCRWMGLIKTKYTDPTKLIWHMPATYGAKNLGDMKFSPTTSQFSDVHDPEIHSDGTILFFDNGGYDSMAIFGQPSTTTYHSRALEYKIDEATKTATLVWEFPGTFNVDTWYKNTWYTPFWGDADRLENGNVLITAGARGTSKDSRIFEVTKADGKVVWEFHLGPDLGVYRAERIVPPLVHAL